LWTGTLVEGILVKDENGDLFADSHSILNILKNYLWQLLSVWRLFEKFVDSPYYSDLELYGGAVMAFFFFSKYLPWQPMHFLKHSTHFLKTCCRLLITSKFLALGLPSRGWKTREIAWGEI
jgi:hypothetical protein